MDAARIRSYKHSDSNMSNLSINSELILRTDIKNATKTILEDICNDFENMDVITPKNKFLAFDKARTAENFPECNASKVIDVSFGREEQYLAEKTVLYNNTLPHQNDLRKKDFVDTSCIKSNGTVNALVPVKESMQQQNSALFNVDSSLNFDNSMQLLNDCREPDKITLVSDSYANNKDLSSSLAELADAEIVQTGDNSVSIIITNPRLIKVMTPSSKNPEPSVATDVTKSIPNRNESIAEVTVESPVTHDVGSQEIGILKPTDTSLKLKVRVLQDPERLLGAASSKGKKKISHCLRKRTFATRKGKYRTFNKINKVESVRANMKARRISAKLKAKWAKDLEKSGRLECPMPGCCQTFVTVANFQTHYKWCTGKKDLQHCLYCDSLIFSSQKAVLHHMEVEHPDKFQEYKAKFPETDEKEISENEAGYQKIDEKIPQRLKYIKKRKFSPKSKENLLSPKRAILKHKMKSIEETAIKNIREFKKCVKFDNIVHKINSVDDVVKTAEVLHQATEIKFPKQRRRKLFLTESIVDDKKYFFDSDDERTSTESRENSAEITPVKINTKSRLVLNMERYKRYNEYLKLTRDWASERRTYSRSRSGFNSFDSSYMSALKNEDIEDTHQLNDSSTPAVSLSISENEVSNEMRTDIREFTLLESDICNSHTSPENQRCYVNDNESTVDVSQNRKNSTDDLIFNLGTNNTSTPKKLPVSAENNMVTVSNGSVSPLKQRVTCYSRSNLIGMSCGKNEALCVRKQPLKIGNIITYGKTVPDFEKTHSQDILPVIDFDALVKNTTFVDKKGKSVCENSPRAVKKVQNVKGSNEILKHSKEDGIKQPTTAIKQPTTVDVPIKRKRGRPPKIRTDVTEVQGKLQDSENKASKLKDEQKYSKVQKNLKNKNRVSNIKRKVGRRKFTSVNHQRYRKVQRKSKANLRKVKLKCRSRQIRGLKREPLNKIVHCAESETQVIREDTLTGDLTSLCLAACMKNSSKCEEIPVKCSQVDDHNYSSCVSENDASVSVPQSFNKNNSANEVNQDGDLLGVKSLQKDNAHSENVYLECITNNFPKNSINPMEILIDGVNETQIQRKDSEFVNNTCELIGDEYNSNPEVLNPVETQTLPLDELPCAEKAEEISNNELFVNCVENDAEQPESVNVSSKCSNDDCSFVNEHLISESVHSPEPARNSADSCVTPVLHSESDKHSSPENSQLQSKSVHNCIDSSNLPGVKETVNTVLNNVHNESKECKQPSNEIKIKRPRGRPRKYPKESSIQKSSVESSSFSESVESNQNSDLSLQVQSNGNSAMCEEMNSSPLMNNTVSADKNSSPVVRKSERVKKRKHDDYVTLESKKGKKDPQRLERNAAQMIVKKTGKRGRPRKYPVDVQMNCPPVCEKNQVNSTNSDTSIYVKDKHYNNVIRKCSRKGRPRKCLRYADINSGVDNESLDGITDSHINNVDGKGEIDCGGKISHGKQILVSENNTGASSNIGSCSECSNCNNEEAEKLILPLKKRKQMAGYKVSKEFCTLHTKSCKCEAEKLEPPKKKSERLSKNSISDVSKGNDTICGSTQGSKLLEQQRNLRSHTATRAQKNTVAATAGKRKKCVDLNGNETNFVHPKKSKQSKSLEEDSTAVEEVEESPGKVSYEKACSNSNYLALKQNYAEVATPSILQDYKQMKSSNFVSKLNNIYTVEPISKSCGRNSFAGILFPSYKPKKSTWHCLLGKEFEESQPPLKNSVLLKIEKTWLKDETDWFQLNCFDSTPLDVTSNHLTFFAGGPIWSAAWCPTPNIQTTQYIALATGSSINNYYSYTDTPEEKGLLQLWNVGHLGSGLETKPSMQLGIAHKHGIVWDMVWCPSGCWEDPNSECSSDDMPCLGLLAVACSNSNIYIYSIPHPESLPSFTETVPLYSTSPSAVLHPLFGDPCFGTRKSMCVSLCWQKNDAYERIAGGYGNGMICVWLVNSSATIIMKDELQKAIAPYLVFQAHGTPVLSLAFAALPGNRWLVSSSFDKTLKFWDLIDTSMPFCSLRKGIARCAQWSPQCCGVYACLDDGLSFKGSSLFKECGIEQIPVRCVSANCNPAKKSSVSDWMNAQAIANAAGTVSVNFMQAMYQEHMKYPFYKHYPIFKTEVTVLANYASDEKDISDIVADITDIIAVVEDLIQTAENTLCIHFENQSSSGIENPVCVLESDQSVEETYMGMNKEDVFDVSNMLSGVMDIVENTVLYDEKKTENNHSFLNNRNVLDTCRWMNSGKIDDMSSVENTVVDIAKTCTSFLKNSLLDLIPTKALQSPNIVNLSDLEDRDSSVSALLQSSSDLHSSGLNSEESFDNRNETVSSCTIIPLSNSNNILNSDDSSLVQTSQHSLNSDVCSVGAPVSQTELSDHISEISNFSVLYHGNQLTDIKNSNLGIKFSNDDENFSENETDTDDESDSMSVDRYSLEQSSSFSDDSLLSECSLTSNSSECSSEYDSGVSDISSSPNVEQVPHSVSNGCSSHSVDVQIVLKSVNNEINNECTRNHENIPENALLKIHTQRECITSSDEYSKKSSVAVTTEMNELSVGVDGYSYDSISGDLNDQDSVHAALIKACEKKSAQVLCEENAELNSVLPKCSERTQHNSVVNTFAESEHLSNLLTTEISVCKTGDTQTDYNITHSKQLCVTDCLRCEKIETSYGLIFKDMDLSSSAVSSPEVDDDTDSFAFDQFHLSSLNTVAWNQNYGCHYYLLSAGSSGIARISCLSGICLENGNSVTSDAHTM